MIKQILYYVFFGQNATCTTKLQVRQKRNKINNAFEIFLNEY
jgi:hypothetical protein